MLLCFIGLIVAIFNINPSSPISLGGLGFRLGFKYLGSFGMDQICSRIFWQDQISRPFGPNVSMDVLDGTKYAAVFDFYLWLQQRHGNVQGAIN